MVQTMARGHKYKQTTHTTAKTATRHKQPRYINIASVETPYILRYIYQSINQLIHQTATSKLHHEQTNRRCDPLRLRNASVLAAQLNINIKSTTREKNGLHPLTGHACRAI